MNENDKLLLFQALYFLVRDLSTHSSEHSGSASLQVALRDRIESYQPVPDARADPDPGDADAN